MSGGKKKFVFLSHGFQATHFDMLKIKHYFNNYRSDIKFICLKSNQEKTTEDIGILGKNFAEEVDKHLANELAMHNIETISFIGHSLGTLQ